MEANFVCGALQISKYLYIWVALNKKDKSGQNNAWIVKKSQTLNLSFLYQVLPKRQKASHPLAWAALAATYHLWTTDLPRTFTWHWIAGTTAHAILASTTLLCFFSKEPWEMLADKPKQSSKEREYCALMYLSVTNTPKFYLQCRLKI